MIRAESILGAIAILGVVVIGFVFALLTFVDAVIVEIDARRGEKR